MELWSFNRDAGTGERIVSDWKVTQTHGLYNGWGYYARFKPLGFLSDGRIAYTDDWRGLVQTIDPRTGEVEVHPGAAMQTLRYASRLLGDAVVGQPHYDSLATYDLVTDKRHVVPVPDSLVSVIFPTVFGEDLVGYVGSAHDYYGRPQYVYVVDPRTGEAVHFHRFDGPIVAPNGFGVSAPRSVYGEFYRDDGSRIHRLDLASGVSTEFGEGSAVWVSPDDEWVLMAEGTFHRNRLVSMASDGSNRREYDSLLVAGDGRHPFAPDGSVFAAAFNSRIRLPLEHPDYGGSPRDGLYESDPETGETRQIVISDHLKIGLAEPSEEYIYVSPFLYSEDGATLYFTVRRQQHVCGYS